MNLEGIEPNRLYATTKRNFSKIIATIEGIICYRANTIANIYITDIL